MDLDGVYVGQIASGVGRAGYARWPWGSLVWQGRSGVAEGQFKQMCRREAVFDLCPPRVDLWIVTLSTGSNSAVSNSTSCLPLHLTQATLTAAMARLRA